MPRERSEFKPKLTIVETWRLTRGAFGARLPGLKMRVLLLAVEGPPPRLDRPKRLVVPVANGKGVTGLRIAAPPRSEEHTSELQSLMRISYDAFVLKKDCTTS